LSNKRRKGGTGMSRFFKYPEPNPRDYETEEDYQEALDEFYAAMDHYSECYIEKRMEKR
jgi:hypothetical protein